MNNENKLSLKVTLIVFAAIYEVFSIVNMVVVEAFDYGFVFITLALAAMILYLFLFNGKKYMNLVIAGGFFLITTLKFIGFIDSLIALADISKYSAGIEVFLIIFNLLIVLIELPLFALLTYLSIIGYDKHFILNAKTSIFIAGLCALVSLLVTFIAYLIICIKYDASVGRIILNFIFGVITAFGLYGFLFYFINNVSFEGLELKKQEAAKAEAPEELEVEVEEPTEEPAQEEASEEKSE